MAVLNGGLPELIIIGVPAATNGTACQDPVADQCSQRSYELTPTPCDSSVCQCNANQPYGGADVFLSFVWEEVIPDVFQDLQMLQGEVSITGFRWVSHASCGIKLIIYSVMYLHTSHIYCHRICM
jgi:hypothetical protein